MRRRALPSLNWRSSRTASPAAGTSRCRASATPGPSLMRVRRFAVSLPTRRTLPHVLTGPGSPGGITYYCNGTCCIGGRAPRGFVPRCDCTASPHAARLAQMAQLEAASVDAFDALHRDLARVGAPRALLAAVRSAARDEVRHARRVGSRRGAIRCERAARTGGAHRAALRSSSSLSKTPRRVASRKRSAPRSPRFKPNGRAILTCVA